MGTATSAIIHFTLRPDGIVLAESQPGVAPNAERLKEAEEACRLVRGDMRRPALWDIRRLVRPDPSAWVLFVEGAPKNLTAIAVLGSEEHMQLLGSFPEVINTLLFPFQPFTDESDALEWLAEFTSRGAGPPDPGALNETP